MLCVLRSGMHFWSFVFGVWGLFFICLWSFSGSTVVPQIRQRTSWFAAKMATVMDGKALKAFVENDQTWSKFVDEKFAGLDKNHTGTLTHGDMEPAIAGVGKALGLPPMGADPETDHIYTEVSFYFLSVHSFAAIVTLPCLHLLVLFFLLFSAWSHAHDVSQIYKNQFTSKSSSWKLWSLHWKSPSCCVNELHNAVRSKLVQRLPTISFTTLHASTTTHWYHYQRGCWQFHLSRRTQSWVTCHRSDCFWFHLIFKFRYYNFDSKCFSLYGDNGNPFQQSKYMPLSKSYFEGQKPHTLYFSVLWLFPVWNPVSNVFPVFHFHHRKPLDSPINTDFTLIHSY